MLPHSPAARRRAVLALVIACACWGGSFTWTKSATDDINALARAGADSSLGTLLLLGWRFTLAGALWLTFLPAARRGWSGNSFGLAVLLGSVFAAGMVTQTLGLAHTSEAVSAFLTSLLILFVPLMMTLVLRRPPAPILWIGVALATAGIWLMTGATPRGFGVGELLGLLCSVVFSAHILLVNVAVAADDPWRMVAGQFVVVGIACLLAAVITAPSGRDWHVLLLPLDRVLVARTLLLVVFASLLAFGLMIFYQPKLDPARAAMVYLTEPIFAAAYAYFAIGRSMSVTALAGAILILTANGLVELVEANRRNMSAA